jgi:hypothetical protein
LQHGDLLLRKALLLVQLLAESVLALAGLLNQLTLTRFR